VPLETALPALESVPCRLEGRLLPASTGGKAMARLIYTAVILLSIGGAIGYLIPSY